MGYDCGNVVEALRDCLSLPTIEAPAFCVELQKQEDVSRQIYPSLFNHNYVHTEQYKHSPGVHMALVVSFKSKLQSLEVLLMLLILAGDVETNPGPVRKLTPLNLFVELLELTDPIPFGKELGIPPLELDRIQRKHEDINEQKRVLCQYIVTNCELYGIGWEKIADAFTGISMEHLAVKIRENYCQQDRSSSDSSTEYLSAEEELPQTVPLSCQPLPEQLPVGKDSGESVPLVTVNDGGSKRQKQKTSGASVSTTMDTSRLSSSHMQGLMDRHRLTKNQLNSEIKDDDITFLAKHFDKIELYLNLMNLTPAEKDDVKTTLHLNGSQMAMIKCLSLWKGHDSFKATYAALLEKLLRLEKEEIANNVCRYLAEKNENSGAFTRESLSSDVSDSSESFTSSIHSVSSLGLQQVPRLQFECGCGQCTVYGFITGETCPNPKAYPFPKLEIYGIPSDDIDYIEMELLHQSTKLHGSFCELVLDTFSELEKSVDIQKLIVYLKILLKPKWYFPSTSSQVLDCLDDLESFDDIAVYLTKQQYCSWFDYELIEQLRNKYLFPTITSSDSVLDDYKAKFKTYVSQRCFIFLHDEGPWPKHQVKVKCKVDSEYDQLSHNVIKHMKYVFAKILGSPNYHLCFKQAREGCTELVFGAPPYFGEISQLSKYQKSQLKAHGFLKVTIREQNLLEFDLEEVRLKDTGSVSNLGNSELAEIRSTCSEADNETSDGMEADIDTTDLEHTSTDPGSKVEVTYNQILNTIFCESKLELQEEMDLDVSPCSLWKALHNGQQCMALKYNGEDDVLKFSKYIEDLQRSNPNVMPAKCVHFDTKLSSPPIILFEVQQPLKEYCFSSETLSEIQQLSLLLNAAISVLGFSPNIKLQMTTESLFVHTTSTDDAKAMFLPMYEHSYFHQLETMTQPELPSLNWLKDTLLLMVHRKQYSDNSELPENHILFSNFNNRWFPDVKSGCLSNTTDVAKQLSRILDLEKTHLEMKATLELPDSEYLEVSHLHMILIGHTGVGKTSIRKHLQNIPFNDKEKSTIIMEQELLYQETFETTVDSKKSTVVFKKYDNVYKSDPDNIYLTLWDTGGQPMFQDLLPCFAKFRSIYGIVVSLRDLLDNSNASIRPTCQLERERESPYTSTDYLYRCLSFLDSTSFDLHLSNLPDMLKKRVFEAAIGTTFPKVAFIGTFKDQIKENDKQELEQMFFQLKDDVKSLQIDFLEKVLSPLTSTTNSTVMFEIDNTRSGAKYEDPGMKALREQIVSCTKSAKAKIPIKWIAFKIDLERESRLQQPYTGIVTFEKASDIAKKHKTDVQAALCYFHELGIFIWYHGNKNLQEYVIVEPKNLLSILGTILDPQVYIDLPEQWKQLQTQGILNVQVGERFLADSKTGLPLSWILSFFEEHHLAMPLLEGYFIPSMLQVLPICPNHQHVFDASISACSVLPADLKVAPLFLVSKSKFVPPGFFPRLMTVLSGIKEGSIIWKLTPNFINCKNMVSFEINCQFQLVFTEFIDCVRAHFDGLTDDNIPHRDLCLKIVSTLDVQLQRVVNTQSVRLTFACSCSEHSSSTHFLKYLPFATDNHVPCGEHAGKKMELTTSHKIWLTDEHHQKITTVKDAEARFEAAMKGKKFGLRFTTILFTGLPGSDVLACKRMIMDKNFTPFESPHSLDPIPRTTTNLEFSYYTVSGENIKPLHDHDFDMVFARNAAVQTPKGAEHDQSDEHSIQQAPKEVSNENPETSPRNQSKQGKEDQSVDEKFEEPKYAFTTDSRHNLTSNPILAYQPIPKESILKCVSSENILRLMINCDQSTTDLDIINCICCSDVWLLDVLPIFLKGITIGINCMSLSQDLEEKIFLQRMSVHGNKIQRYLTSKQLIKDISVLATKLMVVGKHAEFESIETNEKKSEILFKDNEQAKLITDEDGKQAVFEVGKSIREIENIEQHLVSSLTLSDVKHVSLSWHMLGHAIKKVMRHNNRRFISKQEVLIIATEFRLSTNDLEIALLNLHISGLILYFGNVLPNVIFKDSTVLIELIAQINLYAMQHNDGAAIIPITAFEVCEDVYAGGLFTSKDAISLFKDLYILMELGKSLFLMPCLLREEADLETFSFFLGVSQTKVAPLVLQYSVARGFFEYIICYLCSVYNGDPWPWKIVDQSQVFKNRVQFVLRGVNTLITLYRNENAEVNAYVNSIEDHELLPCIRKALVNGLNKAAEAYHISGQALPVVGFHCTCGQVDQTHMIVPSTEGHWRCSAMNKIIALSSAQIVWFTKIHNGADEVTVHNVFAQLIPWSYSWYRVGMLFNLESDVLETIIVQCRQDTDTALMEVIKKWFHTHHNPSWEEVQQIFSYMKEQIIIQSADASLIEQRYLVTEDVFKEYPNFILYVSMSTLLPYLLKCHLVLMADIDSILSPYLDNSAKITNLFNLTKKNGGENGFRLLYYCLLESSENHAGHKQIVEELKRCVPSPLSITGLGSSQIRSPECDPVESLDALIREISDHIGHGWMVLARSLQFTQTDIDSIEYANGRDLKEQIHQFFYQWKRRDGQEATRDMLYAALYDSELNELLKKLDKTDVKKSDPLPYVPPTSPRLPNRLAPESDREFVRRNRFERLAPAAPSPSLIPASLQENAATPTRPLRIPGRSPSVCPFELDDMVMVERRDAAAWCGVVRWIGELPETLGQPVAGIEMENEVPGGGDGSKDDVKYFYCANGRGVFLPVRMLKKDNRFDNIDSSSSNSPPPNQGTPEPQSNAASSESALNDFRSHPFAADWRSPEEVLKQAGLNISPNVSSDLETNFSEGEERVLVFTVPTDHTGIIIGREGRNIQAVERETNTIIKIEKDYGGLGGVKRGVIRGSEENRKRALQMILDRLKKQVYQRTAKAETIQIPKDKVGLIIGTKGQTINAIRSLSGANIDIKDGPTGLESFSLFGPQTRDCTITGSEEDVEKAKKLIRMAENGGNIVVGATLEALIADLASLQVTVEERNNN